MKPISFPEQSCTYAENQPEYLPFPVHRADDGCVTACWKLTWRERLAVLWTGRLWHQMLTFNKPLQPQKLLATKPMLNTAVL